MLQVLKPACLEPILCSKRNQCTKKPALSAEEKPPRTGTRASLVAQLVKNLPATGETLVQSLGLGRSSGEGKGCPLQYSGLKNSMDSPWGCKELDVAEQLSLHFHFTFTFTETRKSRVYQDPPQANFF